MSPPARLAPPRATATPGSSAIPHTMWRACGSATTTAHACGRSPAARSRPACGTRSCSTPTRTRRRCRSPGRAPRASRRRWRRSRGMRRPRAATMHRSSSVCWALSPASRLFDAALRRLAARVRLYPLGTVAVKTGARLAQPVPRLLVTRHGALDEAPKARTVIHVAEMGHLVGGEIIEHEGRREHETPGEGQSARRRAGSPARGLVAHEKALRREIEALGMERHAGLEIEMGLALQPIQQAARRVLVLAR